MLAANVWNLGIALVIVIPCVLGLCFVGFLFHRDSQQEPVHASFPRLIPWTVASRARKMRAEAELEKAKTDLFVQRHATIQKQMVLHDLENEQLRRALNGGDE